MNPFRDQEKFMTSVWHIENYEEIGDVLFSHPVGSDLCGTRISSSDFDRLHICKSVTGFSFFGWLAKFNDVQTVTPNLSNCQIYDDNYYWTGHHTISQFMNMGNIHPVHLSKIISHLAAIKFDKVDNITDPIVFKKYKQWLQSPGLGPIFWLVFSKRINYSMMGLPDLENNWSQPIGALTEPLLKSKEYWRMSGETAWPEIKPGLGYDPFLSAKIFQTILLAINILKNSPEILTSDEQEFIIKLKHGSIGYAAYKKQKNLILHQLNEIKICRYLLGYGDTLENSKQLKTFGFDGVTRMLEIFQAGD
jgi:hypothetical protein